MQEVILIYGTQFGWFDVPNLKKFLDRQDCTDCWLYLESAPVERVARELEKDRRIRIRVTNNPGNAAKMYLKDLKAKGKRAEIKRLEDVSDRSVHRGAC